MRWSRWGMVAMAGFGVSILAAGALALPRLTASAALPGLAAIELVLLALPWSLLLGQRPFAGAGVTAGCALVLAGLAINTGLVYAIGAVAEAWWQGLRRAA